MPVVSTHTSCAPGRASAPSTGTMARISVCMCDRGRRAPAMVGASDIGHQGRPFFLGQKEVQNGLNKTRCDGRGHAPGGHRSAALQFAGVSTMQRCVVGAWTQQWLTALHNQRELPSDWDQTAGPALLWTRGLIATRARTTNCGCACRSSCNWRCRPRNGAATSACCPTNGRRTCCWRIPTRMRPPGGW